MLKRWNLEVFGWVEQELTKLEDQLMMLENNLIQEYSKDVEAELINCTKFHNEWVQQEEVLWCQKVRIKWLQEGDANTRFTRACVRRKSSKKYVWSMILDDGRILASADTFHTEAVHFFQETCSEYDFRCGEYGFVGYGIRLLTTDYFARTDKPGLDP